MARSPNYPGVSLPDAVALVERLYEAFDQREMTDMEAVETWDYSSLSGTSRRKLAALKHYGLVDDRPDGVVVSERAMAIMHPTNDAERLASLRKALYEPTVFGEVLESFDGVPTPGRLGAFLVRDKGFTGGAAKKFTDLFEESVGFFRSEGGAIGEEEDEGERHSGGHAGPEDGEPEDDEKTRVTRPKPPEGSMEYKMNLSRDAVAHLVISGDLGNSDLWLLRSFLANAQMAVMNAVAGRMEDEEAKELRKKLIDDLKQD